MIFPSHSRAGQIDCQSAESIDSGHTHRREHADLLRPARACRSAGGPPGVPARRARPPRTVGLGAGAEGIRGPEAARPAVVGGPGRRGGGPRQGAHQRGSAGGPARSRPRPADRRREAVAGDRDTAGAAYGTRPVTIAASTTGAGVTAPRVVVAGGHSAGHIEPMMNFADALRRLEPTAEITARGYPLELIQPVPLPRKLNRALLQTPGRLRDSVLAAGAVLDRVRAEVVVGFGGYVAGPAYFAARRQGLPIVVHEANARPGVANRLAARMTTHVFTASPSARLAHATAIGIPLRSAITGLDRPALRDTARQRFGLRPDGPVLMVTGGSLGARGDQRRGVRRGCGATGGRRAGAAHHRAAERGRGARRRPRRPEARGRSPWPGCERPAATSSSATPRGTSTTPAPSSSPPPSPPARGTRRRAGERQAGPAPGRRAGRPRCVAVADTHGRPRRPRC